MDIQKIKDILENKADHVAIKKAAIKYADAWSTPTQVAKTNAKKAYTDDTGVINLNIVGNTNYWMDSHEDVHVKGNWSKTISDGGKKFHLHDHKFERTAQVGKFQSLEEKQVLWSDLGVDKEGSTQSLVGNTNVIKEMNESIYNEYKNGEVDQHSVGMRYIKLDFAVNPDVYEDDEANKAWAEVYPLLGNQDKADETGSFWVVREAKLIEISAVLMGSNSLTPTLEDKQKPLGDTSANDAAAKALRTKQFYINLNS